MVVARSQSATLASVTDGIFDSSVAPYYDETSRDMFEPGVLGPTVETLAELANGGRALEFAVGTGRVAIPLSEHGVSVAGIELSQAMVDEMNSKPGSERVPVVIGDMATVRVDGEFGLVYLVYNTISNLLTQDEQVACFCNASEHLAPGGRFVIEVGVPRLRQLPVGETMLAFDVADGHFGVDEYDVVNQRLISHHAWVDAGGGRALDSTHRYAWPAEYDLMARIAGLSLVNRWADWHRAPFTAESTSHVSVWQKTAN
ncbi:MAG: class I SAM-dependent methyltransferase [Actinobacteria bacterium]|nr:class I SAM-dependent methyltransferase [Actinomycetota bacterium]